MVPVVTNPTQVAMLTGWKVHDENRRIAWLQMVRERVYGLASHDEIVRDRTGVHNVELYLASR